MALADRIGTRNATTGVYTVLPTEYATGQEFVPAANPTFSVLLLSDTQFVVLLPGSEGELSDTLLASLQAEAGLAIDVSEGVTNISGVRTTLGLTDVATEPLVIFDNFFTSETLDTNWTVTHASTNGDEDASISATVEDHTVILDTGATASAFQTLTRALIFPVSLSPTLFEARLRLNDVTDVILEFGLTDALNHANGQSFTDYSSTPTAVATNALIMAWNDDTTGAAPATNLSLLNVNASTAGQSDASPVTALTNATYVTLAIAVDSTGDAGFFVDGVNVGGANLAVATTSVFTPWISVIATQAASARTVEVDWIRVSQAAS